MTSAVDFDAIDQRAERAERIGDGRDHAPSAVRTRGPPSSAEARRCRRHFAGDQWRRRGQDEQGESE